MSKFSYIQKYYPHLLFGVTMIGCVLIGIIPALQIMIERNLFDAAILGISGGGLQAFATNLYISHTCLIDDNDPNRNHVSKHANRQSKRQGHLKKRPRRF